MIYMYAVVNQCGSRMAGLEVEDLRTAALMLCAAVSTYTESDDTYDVIFNGLQKCRHDGAPENGIDKLIYSDEIYQIYVRVRNV